MEAWSTGRGAARTATRPRGPTRGSRPASARHRSSSGPSRLLRVRHAVHGNTGEVALDHPLHRALPPTGAKPALGHRVRSAIGTCDLAPASCELGPALCDL